METALTSKATKKSQSQAAPEPAARSDALWQDETGAAAGMPLFLFPEGSFLQTKLMVNQPGDQFEQEADRVARDAQNAQAATGTETGQTGGAAPVQRKPLPATGPSAAPDLPGLSTDSGSPLAPQVRGKVEPLLGADLGHVRVHSGPQANQAAKSLSAKAFTHGDHIWLGSSQSSDDLELMSHEATHVVQQARGDSGAAPIQCKPSDYRHPEDVEGPRQRMQEEIDEAVEESRERGEEGEEPAEGEEVEIDRAEVSQKEGELEPDAQPSVDRPAEQAPVIDQAANQTKSEAEQAAEPLSEGNEKEPSGGGEGAGAEADPLAEAQGAAEQAYALADALQFDETPVAVEIPEITLPTDAGGQPLPANTEADSQIVGLTGKAQMIREQGMMLRQAAAEQRGNAEIVRGNIRVARGGIQLAEEGIAKSESNLEYRTEVLQQGREALVVNEEKTQMVAEQAPEFKSKADEGKEESGPMASEARDMVSENEANTPDDEEAAAKAREQGGQISQVSSDSGTMDDAITQTGERAESLSQEAEEAAQTNEQTGERFDQIEETLGQTEERLGQLRESNATASTRLDGLESSPGEMTSRAEALDQEGVALVLSSYELEGQIKQAQEEYETSMQAVPASLAGEAGGGPALLVQRTPEAGAYSERINLNWGEAVTSYLPSILTGEEEVTEEERRRRFEEAEVRRADQIRRIDEMAGGDFNRLGAGDKMLIALNLMGENLFNSVGSTNWPKFLGHMLQGMIDPRVGLMGIVSGLSMTLSGVANLFSAEQWRADPLGNLLKSAADIAMGITIVLGSITLLATAIALILTAIAIVGSIFSFGAVAAALAPFISFFWSVVTTVGGWTIVAAKITLVLEALVFIKNLICAAVATSASNLQMHSEHMTEDVTNAASAAAMIGMAKVGEMGARTRLGQRFASGTNSFLKGREIPSPFEAKPLRLRGSSGRGAAPAPGEPAVAARPGEAVAPAPAEVGPAPGPAKPAAAPVEAPAAPRPTEAAAPARPAEPPAAPKPAETAPAPRPAEAAPAEAPAAPRPAEAAAPSKPAAAPRPTETTAPARPATAEAPAAPRPTEPAAAPAETAAAPRPTETTAPSRPAGPRPSRPVSRPQWPPQRPSGPKPRINEPGAAEWRYQRYLYEQYTKGKGPGDVLDYDTWFNRHFTPAAKGGRPGRPGGPEQVAAKKALEAEGIETVENVELGGRYPDGINPKSNARGGTDYYEVGKMLEKGMPEMRERIKLADEIKALGPNDTVTFVDKINPSRRITYGPGDNVHTRTLPPAQ